MRDHKFIPPRPSEFYIYSQCPASYSLMRMSGEEPATTYAFKGTKIHKVLAATGEMGELSADEEKVFEELWDAFRSALKTWRSGEKVDEVWNEQEFPFLKGNTALFVGHPDKIVRCGTRLFIVDFKTGWHPKDAITATNRQLTGYAVLADACVKNVTEVTIWIDKPGQRDKPVVLRRPELEAARNWVIDLLNRILAPGEKEPRKGDWCQYCSGKVICPLWKQEVIHFADTEDAVEVMPDEQLAFLAPRLSIAAKVIERLRARLEARVQANPEAFPGWRFKPGSLKPKLTNVSEVFAALQDDLTQEAVKELLEVVKLNIGDLEKIYKKSTGKTWEKTREELRLKLGKTIVYRQDKSSLVYELPESAIESGEQHGNKQHSTAPGSLPGKTLSRGPEEDSPADY